MPSLSSEVATEGARTETSVIVLSLLPLAPLQSEPGDEDRGEQERDHRGGDGGALAQMPAEDRALVAERRHEMRCVHRTAACEHPDQLEVREGEEHRERHHHGDDGRQQRIGDVAEALPRGGAVDGRRFIERG